MDIMADLAEKFSQDELRITHEQNVVLPHVAKADLKAIYDQLKDIDLAEANIGFITDMIACPGLDYCASCQCAVDSWWRKTLPNALKMKNASVSW